MHKPNLPLTPRKRRAQQAPRVLRIYGVDYYIRWNQLHPGCSFFLKTTASAKYVMKLLAKSIQATGYVLKAQNRCEFGYYGVRVWRIA